MLRTHVSSDRGARPLPAAGCRGRSMEQPAQAHPAGTPSCCCCCCPRPALPRSRTEMDGPRCLVSLLPPSPGDWPSTLPPRGNCGRRWRAGLAVPAGRAAVRAFCLKDWLTRGTLYIDALRRSEALAGPTSKALGERTIIGLLGSTIWARPLGHPPVSHLIKGRVPVRPLSGPSASRARGGGSKRKVCGTPAARQAPAPTAAPTAASNTERGGHDDDKTTTTTTTNPEGAEGVDSAEVLSGVVRRATTATPTTPMRYDLTTGSQRTRWLFPGQDDGLSNRRRRVGVDEGVQSRRGSSSKGKGGSIRSSIRSSSSHGRGDGRDNHDDHDIDIDNDNNITNHSNDTQSHDCDRQRLPAGDSWQQPEP